MQTRKPLLLIVAISVVAGSGWVGYHYRSTAGDMQLAAEALLKSLSADQLNRAQIPFDAPARLDWHFIPKETRKGVRIREMTPQQRELAHKLLHSGVSEIGYKKTVAIMSLETILHDLEGERRRFERDPEKYYFTVFGTPAPEGKWGWSVEGHHISLNFVVEDGKVTSATPAFFGANPATVKNAVPGGAPVGTRTLEKEEQLAFDLMATLNEAQRARAVIAEKAPDDIRGAATPQPPQTPAVGLRATELTAQQRESLWNLVSTYANNLPDEVGKAWLDEIKQAGLDNIHFAWAGSMQSGIGHYYRIQGPTFLVEFVNVQSDPAGNTANHIHSVWRSMAGDFGVPL